MELRGQESKQGDQVESSQRGTHDSSRGDGHRATENGIGSKHI